MNYIGLDAGSVSVKLVVLDKKGNKLYSHYERHKGHPISAAYELLKELVKPETKGANKPQNRTVSQPSDSFSLSVTGSAGRIIASVFGIDPVNEIVAHAYSTHKLFPHIKTIIEMGGEDSKLILLSDKGRSIKDFSMNSVCAAGTGSFLDQQAERLRLTIEELSAMALKSERPPRIAGRCSVFAKSDMIHLQQIATPIEDIVAGLCFAVARNFKGSISRGRKIIPPVSFQGGVAANSGMVRAFKEIFGLNDLLVPEDYALMGAIGAALKNIHTGSANRFDIALLENFLNSYRPSDEGYPPLSDRSSVISHQPHPMPASKHPLPVPSVKDQGPGPIEAWLGIDIGSISTNLAVIDGQGKLLAKRYLMTAGRPIDAVKQGLAEIGDETGNKVRIMGVGTTGSGRYMIADYVGADIVKNEITAQATAAAFIDGKVDTIFEIGGQDSKYISLENGVIVDFEMNKACAAGTGSFLEEQAEKLNISIKGEFEQRALSAKNPCRLGERCTVFMENSLLANLQKGADRNDLLAGLAYSIVQNYINRVVAGKKIGKNIFFQGGVAFNRSVVAAFEKYLGAKITVPPDHDVTGAIGMAMIAMKHMKSNDVEIKEPKETETRKHRDTGGEKGRRASTFKGFELSQRPYEISSFECKGCPNVCEINRVKIAGEKGFLFYGGRCEKYDIRKRKPSGLPDLFSFRDEMLWKEHFERESIFNSRKSDTYLPPHPPLYKGGQRGGHLNKGGQEGDSLGKGGQKEGRNNARFKIGIPYIFFFHDYLPFWTTLLWELGFEVVVSPKTNRQVVNLGLERVLSEACFPIKVAHGHIEYLLDKNVDAVFLPSFINLNNPEEKGRGLSCPYTQSIPYVSRVAFDGIRVIAPVVDLQYRKKFLINEIARSFRPLRLKRSGISKAIDTAFSAQDRFSGAIKAKSSEVLSSLKDNAIVIVGRAYNALDSGVNLEIPRKLADLGIQSIPFDFLPLEGCSIDDEWPNMYWRSGQRILKTARFIKGMKNLYAIYIGNFSCGPDSFILQYFKKEMGEKPFLHIEIDEHSADAGAITRCEAFLDSISHRQHGPILQAAGSRESQEKTPHVHASLGRGRIIYIPRMSDHAFALAAAFEHCGVEAEVLPESDKKTTDIGKKYVSGKECYPCAVTTGDMLKKVLEPGFSTGKSAFFMPSGTGPCRFGQYNVFQRSVLDTLGYNDVPIFSPNQDTTFYEDLGIVGKDFTMHAWKGIIAFELLTKSLHETRPYEKSRGSADELYRNHLKKLYRSLKSNNGKVEVVLDEMRKDFENIPRENSRKPLIGVVGEIFVRSHKFSNEDLVRKVEALGGEVWLAPAEEWIYYVNLMGLKKALLKKEKSGIINFLLKRFFQQRIEHKSAKFFKGFLKTLKEPSTAEILNKASPYIHSSFEGEAVLSIGKSIDLLEKGASGIINAMPFGCMPGTIVTAILRGVSRDYGIPCISIPYDGTESATTEMQIEAFMDQAREYTKNTTGSGR
jgi:predicted CoA-substrate-specific enzyme activase